ncbi:hypothetical protein H5410_015318 [Solanum commersonii]|uniref:Uncharacterized protein n=1 Tax=Solanum commersonii TaxID=4109 RepID=A0A9J5ZTC6_SOLCO|nr:hypothetical protein H5410_015318 [Solanum commersonii]
MRPQTISLRVLSHSTYVVIDKFSLENGIFIPTNDMHFVKVPLNTEHGRPTGGCDQLSLSPFPFDHGVRFVTVPICLTAMDLCVWYSRISFTFVVLKDYTVNMEAL